MSGQQSAVSAGHKTLTKAQLRELAKKKKEQRIEASLRTKRGKDKTPRTGKHVDPLAATVRRRKPPNPPKPREVSTADIMAEAQHGFEQLSIKDASDSDTSTHGGQAVKKSKPRVRRWARRASPGVSSREDALMRLASVVNGGLGVMRKHQRRLARVDAQELAPPQPVVDDSAAAVDIREVQDLEELQLQSDAEIRRLSSELASEIGTAVKSSKALGASSPGTEKLLEKLELDIMVQAAIEDRMNRSMRLTSRPAYIQQLDRHVQQYQSGVVGPVQSSSDDSTSDASDSAQDAAPKALKGADLKRLRDAVKADLVRAKEHGWFSPGQTDDAVVIANGITMVVDYYENRIENTGLGRVKFERKLHEFRTEVRSFYVAVQRGMGEVAQSAKMVQAHRIGIHSLDLATVQDLARTYSYAQRGMEKFLDQFTRDSQAISQRISTRMSQRKTRGLSARLSSAVSSMSTKVDELNALKADSVAKLSRTIHKVNDVEALLRAKAGLIKEGQVDAASCDQVLELTGQAEAACQALTYGDFMSEAYVRFIQKSFEVYHLSEVSFNESDEDVQKLRASAANFIVYSSQQVTRQLLTFKVLAKAAKEAAEEDALPVDEALARQFKDMLKDGKYKAQRAPIQKEYLPRLKVLKTKSQDKTIDKQARKQAQAEWKTLAKAYSKAMAPIDAQIKADVAALMDAQRPDQVQFDDANMKQLLKRLADLTQFFNLANGSIQTGFV